MLKNGLRILKFISFKMNLINIHCFVKNSIEKKMQDKKYSKINHFEKRVSIKTKIWLSIKIISVALAPLLSSYF